VAAAGTRTHDTEVTGKKITRLLIQTKDGAANFTGTTNQQLTASSLIDIGTQTGVFVVTFTGESNCSGTSLGWCTVQLRCDGTELLPAVGGDFAFDSVGQTSSTSSYRSLSVTRRSAPVTGGTHSCEARTFQTDAATTLRLDDWT